jgi:hypothetical protein
MAGLLVQRSSCKSNANVALLKSIIVMGKRTRCEMCLRRNGQHAMALDLICDATRRLSKEGKKCS